MVYFVGQLENSWGQVFCTVAFAAKASHCAAKSCSPRALRSQQRNKEEREIVFVKTYSVRLCHC